MSVKEVESKREIRCSILEVLKWAVLSTKEVKLTRDLDPN